MLNKQAEMKDIAFQLFADTYPHEAAEIDWQAFVSYTRERAENPNLTEEQIKSCLERSACAQT